MKRPGPLTNNPHLRKQSRGAKMSKHQKSVLVQYAFSELIKGTRVPDIREGITTYYHSDILNLDFHQVTAVFKEAVKILKEITAQENKTTIELHIDKYEKIYQYFSLTKNVKGQRAAMRAKEKLVGIYKSAGVTVKHNKTTNKVTVADVKYDIARLSADEQKRFTELINKAK